MRSQSQRFPCRMESLDPMRDFLESFCSEESLPALAVSEMVLAVNEAVTNIMEHGAVTPENSYALTLEYEAGQLTVVLRDPGRPYDPNHLRTAQSGGDIKKRRPRSGMGVFLIRQLVDGIIYHRHEDGNELRFIKKVA